MEMFFVVRTGRVFLDQSLHAVRLMFLSKENQIVWAGNETLIIYECCYIKVFETHSWFKLEMSGRVVKDKKKKSKKKIYLKMGFAVWTEGKHANAVKV